MSSLSQRIFVRVFGTVVAGAIATLPMTVHAEETGSIPSPEMGYYFGYRPTMPTHLQMQQTMDMQHDMGMMMPTFAGIPETREASGTSWQPDSTPMHGYHFMSGRWMLMAHYNAFLSYDHQSGPRGDDQINSTHWFMLMARRPLHQDELMLRAMLTLEPATTSPRGYPLLFQSGENYGGKPNVDRQHPHDLFMELAGRYEHPLDNRTALSLYVAPSGEPALGPTAYAHRVSAQDIPFAPIGHHWEDSTHIDFGVVTAGVSRGNVQVEGSWFNGREPNAYRWDIDPIRLNSYSGRISYNPSPNWSLQGSYGYVKGPESLSPDVDVRRTTLSATYNRPRADGGNWASTFVLGRNRESGTNSDAVLLETDLNFANRNTLFGRYEYVDKLGSDLNLTPPEAKFGITSLTIGGLHELTPGRSYEMGVGVAVTFDFKPASLDPIYGSSPMGVWVFLRMRPAPMHHAMSHSMSHGDEMDMDMSGLMDSMSNMPSNGGKVALLTPVDSLKVGQNRLEFSLVDGMGTPVSGAKVTASVQMTSMDMGVAKPKAHEDRDGHYTVPVEFSMKGPWRVILTIAPPKGEPFTRSFDFDVTH